MRVVIVSVLLGVMRSRTDIFPVFSGPLHGEQEIIALLHSWGDRKTQVVLMRL